MQYENIFGGNNIEKEQKKSLYSFIPEDSREKIKESLYQKGITIIDPNQLNIDLSLIESKLLDSKYIFNEEMIESIEVEEIIPNEFHIQLIGKEDQEVVDLEIGSNTSGFDKIPIEWLLEK